MPQARGSDAVFALYDETAYGVVPGTPAGTKIYLTNFRVGATQSLQRSNILGQGRFRARPTRGNINVAGSIATEIGAESLPPLLKHAMGGLVTTGTGPYTHTFTLDDLPVGALLELGYGAAVSGNSFKQFLGCRVQGWTMRLPNAGGDDKPSLEFNIVGASEAAAAAALDATLTDNGHTSFSGFNAAIEEGGSSSAIVTEAVINGANELDESNFTYGGGGVRRSLPEGFATVSGTVTALFESVALLDKAINGTQSSLKITLARGDGLGAAGNESIEFLVQQLEYGRTTPPIEGPAGVRVTVPFEAFRVSTDNGLLVTVKNAVAAY